MYCNILLRLNYVCTVLYMHVLYYILLFSFVAPLMTNYHCNLKLTSAGAR